MFIFTPKLKLRSRFRVMTTVTFIEPFIDRFIDRVYILYFGKYLQIGGMVEWFSHI